MEVYKITKDFPAEEKYGLISQQRRSAVSIPSNISEGTGRGSNPQFRHFLEISMGSCNELITQLELSYRLNFISLQQKDKMIDEATQIYKMILGFYNTLQ